MSDILNFRVAQSKKTITYNEFCDRFGCEGYKITQDTKNKNLYHINHYLFDIHGIFSVTDIGGVVRDLYIVKNGKDIFEDRRPKRGFSNGTRPAFRG